VPWGFWATLGFCGIIGVVYLSTQIVVVSAFIAAAMIFTQDFDIYRYTQGLESNGLVLATAICAAAPFTIALSILFAKIRRTITIKEYLCLSWPGWRKFFAWCLVVLLFAALWDALTFLLHRPVVPAFMVDAYKTAGFLPLLWLAFVFLAPLSEEIFFRGFLFKGLENSITGPIGAVVITSLVWSVMHIQYDAYGIVSLFLGGLLLGFARLKSNSVYLPIAMHILQNIIATAEVIVYLKIVAGSA